jgi:hypothetical protein
MKVEAAGDGESPETDGKNHLAILSSPETYTGKTTVLVLLRRTRTIGFLRSFDFREPLTKPGGRRTNWSLAKGSVENKLN